MKTAFIIHGFNGDTLYTFGPSLKKELEKREYNVIIPEFPIRTEATYSGWTSILNKFLEYWDENTVVICHSIGNPFILKYLSQNKLKPKLYISVAGFCKIFPTGREDLDNAFLDFKVITENIEYCKTNVQKFYSLYSNNDHVIPFNILEDFIKTFNSTGKYIPDVGHMGNRQTEIEWLKVTSVISKILDENI